MNTAMHIKCAFNPVCRIHMNPLEIRYASNVHHVQSTSEGGLEVDSKLDYIIIKDSCEVAPTMKFWLAHFLDLVYLYVQLCSCSYTWRRKKLVL